MLEIVIMKFYHEINIVYRKKCQIVSVHESIYKQTLPLANKLYISHIKGNHPGDTFFPEVDFINDWEIEQEKNFQDFIFRIYKKPKENLEELI